MAFELFGFSFGKKNKEPDTVESFVPRNLEDGASVVETGGFQGMYIDLDGTLKADVDLIKKYREMSLNAEVDMAIDDVVNEAITEDAKGTTVQLDLDKVQVPNEIKQIMFEEFDSILSLWILQEKVKRFLENGMLMVDYITITYFTTIQQKD